MKSICVWMTCAVAMAGCTSAEPVLVPDRGAIVAANNPNIAVIEESGVRLLVNGDAWRSDPRNLPELMTPVKLTVENRTGVRLRIAYQDISLLGASGFRYPALAPMTGEAKFSELVPNAELVKPASGVVLAAGQRPAFPSPRIHHRGFMVARHYYPMYPSFPAWSLAFPYDPFYYQRYQDIWPTPLPTQDMLAEAMPEGVLEEGGRIDGFVYFQNVAREDHVRFEMKLVDATTGEDIGIISVPFAVAHR